MRFKVYRTSRMSSVDNIEINTLEELIKMLDKYYQSEKSELILTKWLGDYGIEIYDDYRE